MSPRKPLRRRHFHQTNNGIAEAPMNRAFSAGYSTRLCDVRDKRSARQSALGKRFMAGAEQLPPRGKIFRRRWRFGPCDGLVSAQNARISASDSLRRCRERCARRSSRTPAVPSRTEFEARVADG
jgi:hypothetical protein